MKTFYDKLREANDAKTIGAAVGALTEAYSIMQPIIKQARARLELNFVHDTMATFRWTSQNCAWKLSNEGARPNFFGHFPHGGHATMPSGNHSSLDHRWRAEADLTESWLPSVPIWTRGA